MNALDTAIRFLHFYVKGLNKHADSVYFRRMAHMDDRLNKNYKLMLRMFEEMKQEMKFNQKKMADFCLRSADRRFGMPMLFGYLNFVHDGYNTHGCYTGTHDLDFMRYTREGVMLYAQRIVAEIFAYVFDDGQSMYDDPDFSEERVEKEWNDFEYFAKYAPLELAR